MKLTRRAAFVVAAIAAAFGLHANAVGADLKVGVNVALSGPNSSLGIPYSKGMLDEPSLGLAPLVVRDILAIVRTLRDDGVSILLVEQNARAALDSSDHGYVLETGEIAFAGASDVLASDPRVQAAYLGGGSDAP